MDRAKRLFLDTDEALARVAVACGFGTARRLSVTFQQRTGLTPTEFRARFRGA